MLNVACLVLVLWLVVFFLNKVLLEDEHTDVYYLYYVQVVTRELYHPQNLKYLFDLLKILCPITNCPIPSK